VTSLAPYVICRDAARAVDFYTQVLGATETMRLAEPSGKVGHAELALGGVVLMLADEYPDHGVLAPPSIGGTPVRLHLYVDDVDAVVERAVAAGAAISRPVEDQFYGDRSGQIVDPFGHVWVLSTRTEALSAAEIERRFAALVQA
jgi:PhnB protein